MSAQGGAAARERSSWTRMRSARNELEIMDGAPAGSPLSCSHSGVLGEAIRAVLSNAGIETSQVPFAAEERNKMQE